MTKKFELTDGKYVDDQITVDEKDTYFKVADIIPSVMYQVYGLDNIWFWDNEGLNYNYSDLASSIKIQVVNGITKTYKKVGDLTLDDSEATTGGTKVDSFPAEDAAPEGAKVGDLYYTESSETTYEYKKVVEGELVEATETDYDEAEEGKKSDVTEWPTVTAEDNGNVYRMATTTVTRVYKVTVGTLGEATETTGGTELPEWPAQDAAPEGSQTDDLFYVATPSYEPAEATDAEPYEYNKYGKEPSGKEIHVTLTPNETLVSEYPGAIISINGKEYDLGHTVFNLVMDRDYRISINWVWGQVVETFRIIKK